MRGSSELTADIVAHPKIRRMHEYWLAKRGQRPMPRRVDIDPLELRDCLGNLCLVDVTGDTPPRFKFRLDGSNLALTTGFDMTGKYADEAPDPAYSEFLVTIYKRVVLTTQPLFLTSDENWKGYDLRVTSVTLPLSSDGAAVDGILDAVFSALPPHSGR